jgi:hypothetical protein
MHSLGGFPQSPFPGNGPEVTQVMVIQEFHNSQWSSI